jgi:hypothetical protein
MLCRDDQCSVHASVNAQFTTNTALWGQKHNTATVAGAAGAEHYHLGAGKKLNKELGVFVKVVPPLFARAGLRAINMCLCRRCRWFCGGAC